MTNIEYKEILNNIPDTKLEHDGVTYCLTCDGLIPPPSPPQVICTEVCDECEQWHMDNQLSVTERIEIFKENIPDIKKKLISDKDTLEEQLTSALLKKAMDDSVENQLRAEWIQGDIDELDKQISRFQWHARPESAKKSSFNLEDIKANVRIETILGQPKRKSGSRSYHVCPLHNDSNPSLVVYEDQNSWYCYPCAKGGSVIDLHMAMTGMEFVDACKDLSSTT